MEAPRLETDFWKVYRDKGVVVVGIGAGETPEKAEEWKTKRKLTYPIFADPEEKSLPHFGLRGLPTNVILDSERKLRFAMEGFDPEGMKKVLDELVE